MKRIILLLILTTSTSVNLFSQNKELNYSNKLTVVVGLTQPILLKGANLAVNYTTNRWIFEYSHGIALDYTDVLNSDFKNDVLSLKSPYSTGAGIGYRFFATKIIGMDLRAEAKVHGYEVKLNNTQTIEYTNFDMGGGVYWQIHPFGKKENGLKGIVIEPSIRYWANVSSSLEDNFEYETNDGRTVIHKPYPLNLFANVSIGYTF